MRVDQRLLIAGSLLALLLAGCPRQAPPPAPADEIPVSKPKADTKVTVSWDDLKGKRVLLVSHPSKAILRSMRTLLRNKLLDGSGLFIVGLYHDKEIETYEDSRAYLREMGAEDMALMSFSCELTEENLFQQPNPCTPVFQQLVQRSAGIIFTGGPDIPPSLYGAPTKLLTVINGPYRQHWELSMLRQLLGGPQAKQSEPLLASRPQYPVLGICRGMQAMNVALGGTMIQDIPSEIYKQQSFEAIAAADPAIIHRNPNRFLHPVPGISPFVLHAIKLHPKGSAIWQPLAKLGGAGGGQLQPLVMSAHHQALGKLGFALEVIATSTDGKVIEAVRHGRFANVLGIQFHPEYYFLWDPSAKAKLRPSDELRNHFTATLAKDRTALGFNRGVWKLFSSWL